MGHMYIDMTRFVIVSRKTGVQRILQDVLDEGWGRNVVALCFTREPRGFQVLQKKPDIVQRDATGARGFARRVAPALSWAWEVSSGLRRGVLGSAAVRDLARRFYSRHLGSQVSQVPRSYSGLEHPPKLLYVLDIPASDAHLDFLEDCVASGTELIVYLYDLMPIQQNEVWSDRILRSQVVFFTRYLNLVARAKKVFCMSRTVSDQYLAWKASNDLPKQPTAVLYPPAPRFSSVTSNRDNSSSRLSGDVKSLRVLAVAPLIRRKNLRVLFSALEAVLATREVKVSLTLVCPASSEVDSVARRSLRRLSRDSSARVKVLREIPDSELTSLYRQAEVLAVPSLYEGFGLPLVEAAIFGCAVIASDIPVFREVAEQVDVTLVDPYAPEAWANALITASPSMPRSNSNLRLPDTTDFLTTLSGAHDS